MVGQLSELNDEEIVCLISLKVMRIVETFHGKGWDEFISFESHSIRYDFKENN